MSEKLGLKRFLKYSEWFKEGSTSVIPLILYAVEQLVEALRYKPEGRGVDSQWGSLGFFIVLILPAALWPWDISWWGGG
jgi:hypothetical protein